MRALLLVAAILLVGCDNSATDSTLHEYTINGIHCTVGVGHRDAEGVFHIKTFDGQEWDCDAGATVVEKPATLESFTRVTE